MDSFGSIVTRLWSGQSAARFLAGTRDFSLLIICPASYSVGPGLFFWGVKCPGREINLSLPSRATVKNEWSYVSSLYMLPWHGQAQLYLPLCSKHKILCNIITHSYNGSFFNFYGRGRNRARFHV